MGNDHEEKREDIWGPGKVAVGENEKPSLAWVGVQAEEKQEIRWIGDLGVAMNFMGLIILLTTKGLLRQNPEAIIAIFFFTISAVLC